MSEILERVEGQPSEPHQIPVNWRELAGDSILEHASFMALALGWAIWRFWLQGLIDSLKHSISFRLDTDSQVKGILWQMLATGSASRIVICQFHNGGTFASGVPYLKLSCTHEVRKLGAESVKYRVQNMPISFLSEELELLYASDPGKLLFAQATDKPDGCRSHLASIGVASVAEMLIRHRDQPIAILVCHWLDRIEQPMLTEIEALSAGLSEMLSRRFTLAKALQTLRS